MVCRVSQKAKTPDMVVRTTEAAQGTEGTEAQHRDGKNGKTEEQQTCVWRADKTDVN